MSEAYTDEQFRQAARDAQQNVKLADRTFRFTAVNVIKGTPIFLTPPEF